MANLTKNQQTKPKQLSLKDFYYQKNKVLIWHNNGGLGDALMLRMLLKDFKKYCPSSDLIVACRPEYIDAIKDHPCVFDVIDVRTVSLDDFLIHYNTCVSIVDKYENFHAPYCKEHRSDIWAKYCGITLESHEMEFRLDSKIIERCKQKLNLLKKTTNAPIVLFCPSSKMLLKTLLPSQIKTIINNIKDCNIVGLHNKEIQTLKELNIPVINDATVEEWMTYIYLADYVISVDTAAFHMAGGLKKPLLGIFTFADGKVYGKHFDFILVQKHRDNGDWTCGPCFKFHLCPKTTKQQKPCLTEISDEEIQNGITKLFDRWPWKY